MKKDSRGKVRIPLFWKLINKVPIIFGVLGFLSGMCLFYLQFEYLRTLPRLPDPQQGIIHPWSIHGANVYMTDTQDFAWYWLKKSFYYNWIGFIISSIILKL
jgi:hypothetical protein